MDLRPEAVYEAVWGAPPFSHYDLDRADGESSEDPQPTGPVGYHSRMATFRNTKYPALRLVFGGSSVKFAGGRLRVTDPALADAVRGRAMADPRLGIRELDEGGAEVDMAAVMAETAPGGPTEAQEAISGVNAPDEQPVPYRALQEALRAAGLSARGDRATLEARLRAHEYGEPV